MQNISSSHQSILEVQSISESCDQTDHTHFLTISTQQIFDQLLIYVNLYQHAKKSGYFIDLFCRYGWLKNPAIWLAENILVHISGTKILLKMGFVVEHSK